MNFFYVADASLYADFVRKDFMIVYQPYSKLPCRRFLLSFSRLCLEVGSNNAVILAERAFTSTGDKLRCRLRSHGIIDFYRK